MSRSDAGAFLPDPHDLVKRGVCLYSDVRDYSFVPSLYRYYDLFPE